MIFPVPKTTSVSSVSTAVETDETDVVFGTGKITPASMMSFVRQYPDSTLKFLLRRNLDGRPLPSEFDQIYKTWEERGLMHQSTFLPGFVNLIKF